MMYSASSAAGIEQSKPVNTVLPKNTSLIAYPQGQQLYDQYPWAVMYYYGITGSDALGQMFEGQFHRWPEHVQSLELTRTLSENNFLRRLVNPLVGVVQVSANITVRNGSNQHTIYEFNPYVEGRWANLPWNAYVNTSFAIGEGISYGTSIPSLESKSSSDTKRLLNYLMLEATFAPPGNPRLQLVARIHHRSGAYGLYHAGNTGSNDVGLGIRYLFD
ncbi:hypothetical protein AQUSIP_22600 [Aquicella siphonis]|uniref:Uncharacterized protein n=1 Tax=Aquicella siphonis TaxID=254247 RepID=A0A5E4PKS9_9COXI|nr:hypothetical protein [Aquicella siphonis]VVC76933.1 hypothetical protein AQUSIP_22600 [Aquicella siphonis]